MKIFSSFLLFAFIISSVSLSAQNKPIPAAPPPPPAPVISTPPAPPTPPHYAHESDGIIAKEAYLAELAKKENKDEKIYTVVQTQPEFPGGQGAMYKFIGDNLVYPASAKAEKVQGKVIIQFVVEKDGKINLIKVVRDGVGHGAANESVNVMQKMPDWKPGYQEGKAVRVQYTLPITFKL